MKFFSIFITVLTFATSSALACQPILGDSVTYKFYGEKNGLKAEYNRTKNVTH